MYDNETRRIFTRLCNLSMLLAALSGDDTMQKTSASSFTLHRSCTLVVGFKEYFATSMEMEKGGTQKKQVSWFLSSLDCKILLPRPTSVKYEIRDRQFEIHLVFFNRI